MMHNEQHQTNDREKLYVVNNLHGGYIIIYQLYNVSASIKVHKDPFNEIKKLREEGTSKLEIFNRIKAETPQKHPISL